MKLTIAAQEMLNALAEVTSGQDLAAIIGLAGQEAETTGASRIAAVHIVTTAAELLYNHRSRGFLARLIVAHVNGATAEEFAQQELVLMRGEHNPMAPDYDALADAAILDAAIAYNEAMAMAQNEPTSQVEDCRDSAEVPGAQ